MCGMDLVVESRIDNGVSKDLLSNLNTRLHVSVSKSLGRRLHDSAAGSRAAAPGATKLNLRLTIALVDGFLRVADLMQHVVDSEEMWTHHE